jgi:hypothetical protein
MKKIIACIVIFVFIIFMLSCKGKRALPEPDLYRSPTQSVTLTTAMTQTPSNTATVTATETQAPVNTDTPTADISQTATAVAPTFTATATATATATMTATAVTCNYVPRLADFGVDQGKAYYKYQAGNTITAITFSTVPGVRFNYGIYDGSHALIENGTATSSSGGGLALDYFVKGTEDISSKWLYVLMPEGINPPASFSPGTDIFSSGAVYDNDKFYVVNVVPTPTNTPACADMTRIGPASGCYLQKYTYKLNCGTGIYYIDRWPSISAANIGWYDGANNLVGTNLNATATVINNYTINGSCMMTGLESAGTWHVVLFNTATTPPALYTSGLAQCGAASFKVELLNAPVAYP